LFGLLTARAAQRLGSISYSVYLLQGIVLTLVFAVPPLREFAMRAPANYWLVGLLGACLLIAMAGVTFVCVEQPCIAFGKRLARRSPVPGAVRPAPRAGTVAAVPTQR
jgi:peptidoglycan/LPS O-acetylase OafA/YrhL